MTISQSTVDRIRKECPQCFCCGGNAEHLHHGVYTRRKKFAAFLDMPENLVFLCAKCHSKHGYLSSWFFRCLVWSFKLEKLYDMETWNNSMGMLEPDHFIYIGKNEQFK
jgi:hypothetical protein